MEYLENYFIIYRKLSNKKFLNAIHRGVSSHGVYAPDESNQGRHMTLMKKIRGGIHMPP